MRVRLLLLVLSLVLLSGCAARGRPASTAVLVAPATATAIPATATVAPPTAAPTVAPTLAPTAAPTATTTVAPATPSAPTPTTALVETYTSTTLDLSLRFAPVQNGQTIAVLEQGDKVYVYPSTLEPTAGQWVQVFSRDAGESLLEAIQRQIMPGYPPQDCQVTPFNVPPVGRAGPGLTYAGIAVRSVPGEEPTAHLARWRTCPQPYTVVGGIGYFQADAAHPDRFLFFSIGQYGIAADEGLLWQETVRLE